MGYLDERERKLLEGSRGRWAILFGRGKGGREKESRRGQGEERKRICAELMLLLAPFTCEEGRRIEGKSAVE